MKPIGGGRASEIFDLGDGRVLRRFRAGGDPRREALVMEHARGHGYPVPRVWEVTADALVLERIDGPTMLAELRRRPWRISPYAQLLAELHEHLHEIAAPAALAAFGAGDRLLHLDLHPDNVIVSPAGPVVVDWTNAAQGDPAVDVALTWLILETHGGPMRRPFLSTFLSSFDRDELRQALPAAGEYRLADPNVSDSERETVRRLLQRNSPTEPRP
jgi:tRNA A-37 threonylcarbamoyl transferase component Bud32